MFDEARMVEINRFACLNSQGLAAFQQALTSLGERIRKIIDETPSSFDRSPPDMSLTKRIEWLQRNVLKSADRLRDALADDPMFAQYPEHHASALTKVERVQLDGKLARLSIFASDLIADFESRIIDNVSHNTEMRREFCFWICDLIRTHVPDVSLKRSTYDKEHGDAGDLSNLLRLIYIETTSENVSLEEHLKEYIKLQRRLST